jgi:hypothetical protein
VMERPLHILAALAAAALAGPPPAQPPAALSQAIGAALQADSQRALSLVNGLDLATLSPKNQATVICMRERLSPAAESAPASAQITDRALAIYQRYWVASMAHPEERANEEKRLADALRNLLGAPANTDMDALEPLLAAGLTREGFHSLQGQTGLLRELMIWSKQDERLMPVALPEGKYEAKVELLDGFKSFGWSSYATCGRASTGGWTTDDALFAVVPRYSGLDSEEFRVSFLGHETQHFADKAHFKGLQSWELEYRAKLTELAQAQGSRGKVLDKFMQDQGDDTGSPHSYANRRVLNDMIARLHLKSVDELMTFDGSALAREAVALLREDTQRRAGQRR